MMIEMAIKENLQQLKDQLPVNVTLVAVSKTKSPETILEAYRAGQRIFGESKAQEMLPKYEALPKDIQWHMVGHLQSNKVKYIAPFVSLIHSVDSLKLLKVINKEAAKNKRTIACLLQIHIAEESSKFGLSYQECCEILESESFQHMKNIEIHGLMGMATFTDDQKQVEQEFRKLKKYFDSIKNKYFSQKDAFKEVSMGMSDDFQIGIEQGSTMVRIGSAIFGSR